MHLNHDTFRLALHRPASCVLIASGCALYPTSFAYGITVDELVGFVAGQPLVTFGVGCATGAVVGGLVAALVGRGRRRALERELEELKIMIQQQSFPDILSESEMDSTLEFSTKQEPEAQSRQEAQVAQAAAAEQQRQKPQEQPVQPAQATPVSKQAQQPQQEPQPVQAAQAQAQAKQPQQEPQPVQAAQKAEHHKGEHSVRDLLFSRLSSEAFEGVPVITRGAERKPDLESTAKRVALRRMDGASRAKAIDKRIPRFDESMFPESPVIEESKADEFEQAMSAMEQSMSQAPVEQSEPDFEFTQPENHPEIDNATAYVDYLVNDEMEINRSYRARRFSRSQLTVFEGTGDLSKARQHTHRARHLSNVSKEA